MKICVDQSSVRTLKLFDTTGLVENNYILMTMEVPRADQLHILELVLENPGIYLHELQARGTDVYESTICRFLQWANVTHKKTKLTAIQQSEELRAKYVAEISVRSQYASVCG